MVGRVEFDQHVLNMATAYMKDGAMDDIGPTGIFWLGGYKSEMIGTKAESLAELARATRRNLLRFDYFGHGQSQGLFVDGTISLWLEQATHMFLTHTKNRRVIVGSSMGGWLALLLARRLMAEDPAAARRMAGIVLLAPAADMTRDLMWNTFSDDIRRDLMDRGVHERPSAYGEPYQITMKLLQDGEQHLLLPQGLRLPVPVRILQGTEDSDVPPAHAIKTLECLNGDDITLTLVKGADHRLSSAGQLALINETVMALVDRANGVSP